jgi:hypothetical protein
MYTNTSAYIAFRCISILNFLIDTSNHPGYEQLQYILGDIESVVFRFTSTKKGAEIQFNLPKKLF